MSLGFTRAEKIYCRYVDPPRVRWCQFPSDLCIVFCAEFRDAFWHTDLRLSSAQKPVSKHDAGQRLAISRNGPFCNGTISSPQFVTPPLYILSFLIYTYTVNLHRKYI